MRRRLNITASFLDIMFNILLGFFTLLMISIVLVNPVKKNKDVELKAEFIITMEWDDKSRDDVDLFVSTPNKKVVFYGQKDHQFISLDRDDRGDLNDKVVLADKTEYVIHQNWEHVIIRKGLPGEYIVNVHVYQKRDSGVLTNVKVKVERLNPYELIFADTVVVSRVREEVTIIRFTLDRNGKVVERSKVEESLIDKVRL